jgi:excisionase family DNA binding protein
VPAKSNKLANRPELAGRRWATIVQASEYLGVHVLTVRRLIAAGKLKSYAGASWRIVRVDLNEIDALMVGGE